MNNASRNDLIIAKYVKSQHFKQERFSEFNIF
jgi:hypothetical protein